MGIPNYLGLLLMPINPPPSFSKPQYLKPRGQMGFRSINTTISGSLSNLPNNMQRLQIYEPKARVISWDNVLLKIDGAEKPRSL